MLENKILQITRRICSHPYPIRFFGMAKTAEAPERKTANEKLIKVAIIGVPNVGKSTLINNLLDHRVCPTSNKVHTTRETSRAITMKNNSQIILFDTPGMVSQKDIKKHQLEKSFLSSCRHSIQNAHLIGIVHDVSNQWTRNALNPIILQILEEYVKVPSFLILNKIDTLKSKRVLLDVIKNVTNDTLSNKRNFNIKSRKSAIKSDEDKKENKKEGWSYFQDVFMVSAVTGDGLTELMTYIQSQSKPEAWEHLPTEFTDQSPEKLIEQSVRARLLDYLPQEIPYLLKCEIEFYNKENDMIFASVVVTCPNERHERLVCGVSNGKLRQITERVTSDLVETFAVPVSLTIATRAQKEK